MYHVIGYNPLTNNENSYTLINKLSCKFILCIITKVFDIVNEKYLQTITILVFSILFVKES